MHTESEIPTKKKKLINRWTAFVTILITALATIFFVDSTIKANETLKDIESIKAKIEIIENNNIILMEQINRLQSPKRILSIAENKFKMVTLQNPPKVIIFKKNDDARD
jgi:cell division protein FtsL